METTSILKKPMMTEKSLALAAKGGYTFVVPREATKPQIKGAVESQFKVKVVGVQTANLPGKVRRAGRKRLPVKTPGFKKAIVYLASGQKLEIFEMPKEG